MALERVDLRQRLMRHDAAFAPFFFAMAMVTASFCRRAPGSLALACGPEAHEDVVARLLGAVLEHCHVFQIDRRPLVTPTTTRPTSSTLLNNPRVDENFAVLRG